MSLAATPGCQPAFHAHLAGLRLALQQALRGQHVLDLAGADAEGQRAKRAVGGGVAVAAHDRHARLGQAQLRTDDVHDALAAGCPGRTAGCQTRGSCPPSGGFAWRPSHQRRPCALGEPSVRAGGDAVIHRGDGRSGRRTFSPRCAQPGERLRRGHLVDQVQVDVQDGRRIRLLRDDMADPRSFQTAFSVSSLTRRWSDPGRCGCMRCRSPQRSTERRPDWMQPVTSQPFGMVCGSLNGLGMSFAHRVNFFILTCRHGSPPR